MSRIVRVPCNEGPDENLEVEILVARMLAMVVVIGLANLASLGFSPLSAAQAAYPAWSAYATPAKRPQFRPTQRGERQTPAARWRPESAANQRRTQFAAETRRPYSPFTMQRTRSMTTAGTSNSRYTAPQLAFQRPDLRFRPDRRQAPAEQRGARDDAVADAWPPTAQFRPAEKRRRQTYEQMQYASRSPMPMPAAPPMAYATPPYGRFWPAW